MSDRTEEPTPRRLERARSEGDVPVSHALLQAVGLVTAAALAPSAIEALSSRFHAMVRATLSTPDAPTSPLIALREAIHLSMPLLLAVGGAVALVGVVQTRALFEPKRIAPDLQRLSPSSMLRSLISSQRLFAIVRAIATAGVAGYLAARRLGQHLPDLAHSTGRLDHAAQVSASIAGSVARDTILVVLGLAAVDWIVTQRAWISRLRMTKQEVQREHRESEGDPQLKSDRERAHQEMLASATIAAVKDATVVIINPTRLANALRYREEQDETPVLIARAEGELARRIVDTARAYGIPIVQDVSVARALSELSQGDCIPPALYEAVGIILRDIQDA